MDAENTPSCGVLRELSQSLHAELVRAGDPLAVARQRRREALARMQAVICELERWEMSFARRQAVEAEFDDAAYCLKAACRVYQVEMDKAKRFASP